MTYSLLSTPETIGRDRWTEFVAGHSNATVFQMPEMFDHYSRVPDYTPVVLALESKTGKLAALLLAVIIRDYIGIAGRLTARCVVYGGPLTAGSEEEQSILTGQILAALIEKVRKQTIYIQFRNFTDVSVMEPVYHQYGFEKQDHLNLIVNTADAEETLAAISKSKKRQARRSSFSGAELQQAVSEEEIHAFYQILKKVYKHKVHKPLPSESFFLSFYHASQQGQLGKILVARYQGKIVGGMVCPITPGKSLNEWYVCGLDKQYREIHPSVFLTYGAIEYAIENNIPSFDFMGIGSPDKPYGVRDFKVRFGGDIVNYGRFQRINNPLLFPVARAGFSLLSFLRLI